MKFWKHCGIFAVVSLSFIAFFGISFSGISAQAQSGNSGISSGSSSASSAASGANANNSRFGRPKSDSEPSGNPNDPNASEGPYSGWSAYRTGQYKGGEHVNFTGEYVTTYNKPIIFNPLTSFIWSVSNKPPFLGDNWFVGRINSSRVDYWRGTAGYFYPWLNGGGTVSYSQGGMVYVIPAPIIFWGGGGGSEPVAQLPPPAIQLADSEKFLDDSFKDKKVLEARYKHLKLRASDLKKKERSMRIAAGGELDKDSEAEIRRDLDSLNKEMSAAVKTSV